MNRIFLISPANCNGQRVQLLLGKNAGSDVAKRLRSLEGAKVGDIFSFLSALYFRGKLEYARAFARPPTGAAGVLIITPTAGLLPHDAMIRLVKLRGFSRVPIHAKNPRYRYSLLPAVKKLAMELDLNCEVILLGSVASGKYLDILAPVFGDRLRIPAEFIGRGDMSRGGLLLRCVKENRELTYIGAEPILRRSKKWSASEGLRNSTYVS